MRTLGRELRFAVRALRKQPAFSAIVVLTLGLGIGANTAIFSLLDQVLLRRLPVQDPQQLVLLDGPGPFQGRTMNAQTFSYPMYRDFRDRTKVFSGVLGRMATPVTLTFNGQAERVNAELVTGNFFDVLGARPVIGRLLHQQDDVKGAPWVMVISEGFWRSAFGGDPNVIGRRIDVMNREVTATVVGVAPAGLLVPRQPEMDIRRDLHHEALRGESFLQRQRR